MKVQALVEIEGDDLDCDAIEKMMYRDLRFAGTGEVTSVTAIVRNSQGETHMDEYIDQQVSKAIAYEDTKHYVESGKK